MAFNLDQFRTSLVNGGARPSLFEVELRWPSAVATGALAASYSRFMVQSTAIPASTIGSIDVPYFGRKLKVAGDRTFAPLNVTIMNDENFAIRKALEEWSDRIAGHRSATSQFRGGNQNGTYTTELALTQFGRQGNRIRTYKFIGAFPTTLSEIALDWNTADTIETYTCEFSYQYWEVAGQIPTRDTASVNIDITIG
jgi:hypothetical protein